MVYEYRCEECDVVIEKNYKIGKAATKIKCPDCGSECERHYSPVATHFKGGGWPSKFQKFNREMTEKNERAGRRMRKTWDGTQPKLVDN